MLLLTCFLIYILTCSKQFYFSLIFLYIDSLNIGHSHRPIYINLDSNMFCLCVSLSVWGQHLGVMPHECSANQSCKNSSMDPPNRPESKLKLNSFLSESDLIFLPDNETDLSQTHLPVVRQHHLTTLINKWTGARPKQQNYLGKSLSWPVPAHIKSSTYVASQCKKDFDEFNPFISSFMAVPFYNFEPKTGPNIGPHRPRPQYSLTIFSLQ